jgi:hypothetical protein
MPWLVAPLVALGVVTAAGPAAPDVIYVPGEYRDGVYTHPHFLDAPLEGVQIESDPAKMPKPIIVDEPAPPEKLPSDSPS